METSVAASYIAQARARNLSRYTIDAYSWGLSYITAPTVVKMVVYVAGCGW